MRRSAGVELALSCHPEPVVAVTAIACILALFGGRGAGTVLVGAAVLTGQLFVGWTNDYVDRQRDAAAGRRDKPVAAGRIEARTVRAAAVLALGLCILLSLACGIAPGLAHLVAVALATSYNLGLKATVLSVVPYATAFPLLVVFITLGLPRPHLPPTWSIVAAALLAAGAHFAQVLPDIDADRRLGTLGLPQRLGVRVASFVAPGLLALAALTVAFAAGLTLRGLPLALAALSIVLSAVVFAAAALRRYRLAFRLTLAMVAAIGLGWLAAGRSI